MLSRGFKDQIYEVFKSLPNDVQVYFCRIPIFPCKSSKIKGCTALCYNAKRSSGSDQKIHAGSNPNFDQKGGIDPGRHSPILYLYRQGGCTKLHNYLNINTFY